jgi:hypothetical protein
MDHVRAQIYTKQSVLNSSESKIVSGIEKLSIQIRRSVACKLSCMHHNVSFSTPGRTRGERKSHLKGMFFECENFFVLITEES